MKFISVTGPGGPEVLKISEGPVPSLRAGEVLIEVHAAGVNRPDIAQRSGTYPPPSDASPILGLEVAGVVSAVGDGVSLKVGERVCALTPGGGYAEFCAVPASHCLPIPVSLSYEEAAGIPENYFTVWANVFELGRLVRGETFLVHGGSSGIGTTAIQLAHAFGAKVLTTAGSQKKCDACVALGADVALNYKERDFAAEFKGVDVILDMVAGGYTRKNIECLAPRGRLVQIAVLQGAEVSLNIAKVMQKRVTITGSTLRPRSIAEKAGIARELEREVWPLFASGKTKVLVDRIYPFEKVAEAHARMESSEHIGKIILKWK